MLSALRIPYMVVGSFSTNRYGIPRSTRDADFVIELGERSIFELARSLPPAIRIDPQMSFETVTLSRRYQAKIDGTDFEIELFLLSDDPHNQERFRRRRSEMLLGRTAFLPSVEDVIITKLRWTLLANRTKDRDDVRNVLAVQCIEGQIDWDYVHSWCDRHGTRALLDEIRRSIPPI
jgi:hypothetical protein